MGREYIGFDHEKLLVYQKSLQFIEWLSNNIDCANYKIPIINQLDRASISILLNIAEGNSRTTSNDKCRYFDISRASAMECAACLDILFVKKIINETINQTGKKYILEIVSMITGLIKSKSNRVYETQEEYK